MSGHEGWDQVAPAWERHRARIFEGHRAVSEWLVEQVAPREGRTILELTAGPGETSFLAAERGGTIICSDFAPNMVEAARRGAQARGLRNVECRRIDARAIDLPDDSVDGVMSRFGMMAVPDQPAAFSEVRRVLAPGGRFAYAVWGEPRDNLWVVVLGGTVMQCGFELPGDQTAPGGMFSLKDPDRNMELARLAGFEHVDVDGISMPIRFESFDEYWLVNSEVAGSLANLIGSLPADDVERVRAQLEVNAASFRAGDGSYEFPTSVSLVRAS